MGITVIVDQNNQEQRFLDDEGLAFLLSELVKRIDNKVGIEKVQEILQDYVTKEELNLLLPSNNQNEGSLT